jgi:restriction system protein
MLIADIQLDQGASRMGEVFWFLLGGVGLAALPVLIWVVRRIREEGLQARAGLTNLGAMTAREFDAYVERLFRSLGYKVEPASGRESLGVDWILTDARGYRTALQTRRWRSDVGPEAIQQVTGGTVYHRCDEMLILTTATFTPEARRLARQTGTKLWDLEDLAKAASQIRAAEERLSTASLHTRPAESERAVGRPPLHAAERAREMVAAAQQAPATNCPRCGKEMVRRAVNGQPVLVCRDFPQCNGARLH